MHIMQFLQMLQRWRLFADLFLQQAAGNFEFWLTVFAIGNVARLDHLVHNAPFRNSELKQVGFVDRWHFFQHTLFKIQAMHGKILTQGTAIYPAIGKNKEIFGNQAGTVKRF